MRYDGDRGSGALRLILKLESRHRYRIETKDRFGRGLWRIEFGPEQTVLVDDRQNTYCESHEGVRIPEIALESLPLEELPAILLGRLPGDLGPLSKPGWYRDSQGRRWTASGGSSQPDSWTVWQAGEPWLWWGRDEQGEGVLSHRDGSQLRWRHVAGEPLVEGLVELRLEPRYEQVACDEWSVSATSSGRDSGDSEERQP